MQFLSNEWFDAMTVRAKAEFSKPGKLTLSYCEAYTGCPDGVDKWLRIELENGIMTKTEYGTGECPKADYRGFGKYADHVRICKGELNPKKAVMEGTFSIEDNVKAGAMRTIQLIGMYTKLVEAKKLPGVTY